MQLLKKQKRFSLFFFAFLKFTFIFEHFNRDEVSCSSGLLASKFTGNNFFPYSAKVNLPLRFEMHLSKKLKTFSQFFIGFLKFTFIFEHFRNDQVS